MSSPLKSLNSAEERLARCPPGESVYACTELLGAEYEQWFQPGSQACFELRWWMEVLGKGWMLELPVNYWIPGCPITVPMWSLSSSRTAELLWELFLWILICTQTKYGDDKAFRSADCWVILTYMTFPLNPACNFQRIFFPEGREHIYLILSAGFFLTWLSEIPRGVHSPKRSEKTFIICQ